MSYSNGFAIGMALAEDAVSGGGTAKTYPTGQVFDKYLRAYTFDDVRFLVKDTLWYKPIIYKQSSTWIILPVVV